MYIINNISINIFSFILLYYSDKVLINLIKILVICIKKSIL